MFDSIVILIFFLSVIGHEYVTNLPLQMALYFNFFFFPFWFIGCLVILELKVRQPYKYFDL